MRNDVLCYEVELLVEDKTTKARELVTRREYAYSLQDAMLQAAMALVYERPNTDVKVSKIGPPRDLVEAASSSDSAVMKVITDAMLRAVGTSSTTDG